MRRILELGFKYDYIYKLIAEAYHDLGDDEQARAYLRQAYELNPELSGAVRISRILGFSRSLTPSPRKQKSSSKYKYSRPDQIPSSAQVHELVREGNWDAVIEFANPYDYSPRILSKTRQILNQIADSLGDCKSSKAIEVLICLALKFNYYWDVSEAAMISLSKIGDKHTLDLLENFRAGNLPGYAHYGRFFEESISYLRARVNNQLSAAKKASTRQLLAQAETAFAEKNYGQARILLGNLLANTEQSDSIYLDATVLLARSCAGMNDVRSSVELVKPLLSKLPEKLRGTILQEVAFWLSIDLMLQQYAPFNDEDYRLALDIHLELALITKTPDDVLRNLKSMTRWLEFLGVDDVVQWIRQLIRAEVPGTSYVDKNNREQYIQSVDLSPYMRSFISSLDKQVKAKVTAKLKHLLKSAHTLETAKLLLDDQ